MYLLFFLKIDFMEALQIIVFVEKSQVPHAV